jgi:predicted enzyme related to lactoylglutathione lyase
MATTLASILLSSTDPERLGAWYASALEPDTDTKQGAYRILGFGGFFLLIDTRGDIGATNLEPGRVILNFEVTDAAATAAKLDELGVSWHAPLEDRDGDGTFFATAIDPDGNYVQLIQFGPEHPAKSL